MWFYQLSSSGSLAGAEWQKNRNQLLMEGRVAGWQGGRQVATFRRRGCPLEKDSAGRVWGENRVPAGPQLTHGVLYNCIPQVSWINQLEKAFLLPADTSGS